MWTVLLIYAAACMVIGTLAVMGEWLAEFWHSPKQGETWSPSAGLKVTTVGGRARLESPYLP
jgi:hypothetical protein